MRDLISLDGGLQVRVVDPSHVAMIQMDIDAAAFDTWELDETKICLEMRKLKEMVALGAPDDHIEMNSMKILEFLR